MFCERKKVDLINIKWIASALMELKLGDKKQTDLTKCNNRKNSYYAT